MYLVSFDIGLRTCSVACEEYTGDLGVAPEVCYTKTLEATEEMREFIKKVGERGRVVHLEKRDLGDKKAFFADHAFKNLYKWCRDLHEHLQRADLVLIEQQMKCNNIALALMYHLQAFLLITYENKHVRLYPSKNKTRVLGAPLKVENDKGKVVKVTKYQRKKWSTQCADDLLKRRGDLEWHKHIFVTNKSKKDDLSDVLMQNLSYMVSTVLRVTDPVERKKKAKKTKEQA